MDVESADREWLLAATGPRSRPLLQLQKGFTTCLPQGDDPPLSIMGMVMAGPRLPRCQVDDAAPGLVMAWMIFSSAMTDAAAGARQAQLGELIQRMVRGVPETAWPAGI